MSTLTGGSDYYVGLDGRRRAARVETSAALIAAQRELLERSTPRPFPGLSRLTELWNPARARRVAHDDGRVGGTRPFRARRQ